MKQRSLLALLITISFSAALLVSSCKKDDNNTIGKSKSELIIGSWSYTNISSDKAYDWENDVIGTDGFTYRKTCMEASILTFNKGTTDNNGQFLIYDDCDEENGEDTWILQSDVLSVAGDDFKIDQLDNTTLKLSFTDSYNNQDVKITYTFKRR
ncbi:MAG TPA: hypothetical protein VL098_08510 [Flavipsychrobacter sp.]|nr:hypothetical protein [Flavipsychrobacter sp.]